MTIGGFSVIAVYSNSTPSLHKACRTREQLAEQGG